MREAQQATKADGRVCTFKPSDLYLPKAPFEWWNSFGTELPELAEFAKRAMTLWQLRPATAPQSATGPGTVTCILRNALEDHD